MAEWTAVKLSKMTSDLRLDTEYYRPEYLRQDAAIAKIETIPLGAAAEVSDGNHLSIAEEFSEDGIRYLRGQDLSDFFISDVDPLYIPEKQYAALARSHMYSGDVLVGIVGTIGTVGIVTKRHGKLTGSCKLAIIRSKSLPPEYLAAYLGSRVGQNEIRRRTRGAVQMGLILPDLRDIPVVQPSEQILNRVISFVSAAQQEKEESKHTLESAEGLLMEILGLDHLDLTSQKCYSRNFSELQAGNRFGSEYYMPCKMQVLSALAELPHRTIAEYATSVREMWDPTQVPGKERVCNFDLADAIEPFLHDHDPQFASDIGSIKKRFRGGDVVISRLRSYLREIAVAKTSNRFPTVGSSEFIVLRPTGEGLSAETLMVFLRCPLVQTILKWSQDGSNHPRFAEEDLLAMPVPVALLKVQNMIDPLVEKSIEARKESARLLQKAQETIEDMIPGTAGRGGR